MLRMKSRVAATTATTFGHLPLPHLTMGAEAQNLEELARSLVVSLRGEQNSSGTARRVLARLKNDTGTTSRREWSDARTKLKGWVHLCNHTGLTKCRLIQYSRIKVEDDIADAYGKALANLEEHRRIGGTAWDEQLSVNASNLPQHVQFLVSMDMEWLLKLVDRNVSSYIGEDSRDSRGLSHTSSSSPEVRTPIISGYHV